MRDLALGFGKHARRKLSWLVHNDPSYLLWLAGTDLSKLDRHTRGAILNAARLADNELVTRKLGAFRQVKTYEQRHQAKREAAHKAAALNMPKQGA
jgi:hypothetical protein